MKRYVAITKTVEGEDKVEFHGPMNSNTRRLQRHKGRTIVLAEEYFGKKGMKPNPPKPVKDAPKG